MSLSFRRRPQSVAVGPPDVEVLHVDVPVGGSLPLAPKQKTFLSGGLWRNTCRWPEMRHRKRQRNLEPVNTEGVVDTESEQCIVDVVIIFIINIMQCII